MPIEAINRVDLNSNFFIYILKLVSSFSPSLQPPVSQEVRTPLSNHSSSCICICANDLGHDTGIAHSQPAHSFDSKERIHYCLGITVWTHFDCPHRMKERGTKVPGETLEILGAGEIGTTYVVGNNKLATKCLQGRCILQVVLELKGPAHCLHIPNVVQIVGEDSGRGQGILMSQGDRSLGIRVQ